VLAARLAPRDLVSLANIRLIECRVEPIYHELVHPASNSDATNIYEPHHVP